MKKLLLAIILCLTTWNSNAQTFSWTGNEPIMDNQTDTIPIIVSGLPTVIDTTFGLAHVCMDITHTYKNDLVMKLMSPSGLIITLISGVGGSANNFLGTCVGMDGTAFSNGQAPYTGIYLPTGNTSLFNNGQNPNGTWKFIVSDQATTDTGSIHTASIVFVQNPPNPGQTTVGSGPQGTYTCATCVCPGGASACDLLPDMTASAKEITVNHTEAPGFLYIANATPNIGYGPIDIFGVDSCYCGTTLVPCGTVCPNGDDIKHLVKQRIYQKVPGTDTLTYYDREAGKMTYHAAHGHLHVDHWSNYTLRTATSNPDARTWPIVGTGVKQSFCLINLGHCSTNPGQCVDNNGNPMTTFPNNNFGFHTGCGLTQGIYPGNYDVYSISLNDPIPLNNICNGTYYVVSITDPENNFLESDENNNWVAVPITLTQQNSAPTITAAGPTLICAGGSVTLNSSVASNYLWSTGETTQSITVSAPGSYTVSTNCGSSVSTSTPVVVSTIPITASATATEPSCNGNTVQLNATGTSGGTQNVSTTFSTNVPVVIPDNNSTGVTSPIVVSGISPATLTTTSVVSVRINLTHTYDGDLAISLVAPSGNTILLSNRRGSGGDNFINTVFSMPATTLISTGTAPFTGTYRPDGNFNALTGNANGTWLLKVQDLANVDTGRIQNWTLNINNAIPETISYSWTSTPSGFTSSVQNPTDVPVANTTYTVVATSSATGCSATNSVSVAVPDTLSINSFAPVSGVAGTLVTIIGTGFTNASAVTFAGNNAASFTVISATEIQAVVPNVSPVIGAICVTNDKGCIVCSASTFAITTGITLNVKLYIEGFYISAGQMKAVADPIANPSICDTIVVKLHQSVSPYSEVQSFKSTINTIGEGSFVFPSELLNGSFYISVHHRNALETWSSSPVTFTGAVTTYIFSDAITKALGSNMRNLGDGRFALFSGDVDQSGTIEVIDMNSIQNAAQINASGYIPEDLNGDGIVESSDYSLFENNMNVFRVHP
ncbi:MAG: proprotein convertase P-domain-containing protein [Bacteroidia bacterium]|nr:proprotein convertase P-domain-containing protein [Bacteroidota bacterium]MBP6427600.1 proprotein convertase P-domain-containing protein [Bacteroidia bacterium]MBP6657331.1 proprotein convertase P-domain-containing protein [Bacteroidia bacterium]